jgi:hypothetical protein
MLINITEIAGETCGGIGKVWASGIPLASSKRCPPEDEAFLRPLKGRDLLATFTICQ